jgi:Nuclease-related domain
MESQKSRSPLKNKPLRSPGDSLRDSQLDLVFYRLLPWLWVTSFCWLLMIQEWLATSAGWSRHPGIYAGVAAAATLLCAFQFWRSHQPLENNALGREGELIVAESLEKLRALGAHVFHDVPAAGFNLDHVVLSTCGFFVIETKTHSKPKRGKAEVTFTENSVRVAGHIPNRDPVAQVQAEARWLPQLFETSTGRPAFPIKGVVVYPGWTVQRMSTAWKRSADLPWVLPPEGLQKFMEYERTQVSPEDVSLAAFHLDRYIRSEQAQRAKRA